MSDDEEDDLGPDLGVKDLAVLRAIDVLPKQGAKVNLKNICTWTTLDAREVFDILRFLEEHGFINERIVH